MTATISQLNANTRTASGKGEVRRLRAQGQIPAVAYGKGLPSTLLSVIPKEIVAVIKSEKGQNTVLELKVAGASDLLVMIKDYAYHPLTRNLQHVDFVQVNLDTPVEVNVPLVVIGKPAGVTMGGILRQVYRTLPVICVPAKIPLKIEIDVTSLNLNEAAATQDLQLPEGVTVNLAPELTIVAVVAPEKDRAEDLVAAPGAAPAAAAGKDAKAAPAAKDAKKK